MPKKSRRVASRQAQLSGRAKRVRAHGPAGIPATKRPSPAQKPRADDWAPVEPQPSPERAAQEIPPPQTPYTTSTPIPRLRGRTPQRRPIETYFVPELRRIGVTSAVVFAILVILVLVLR